MESRRSTVNLMAGSARRDCCRNRSYLFRFLSKVRAFFCERVRNTSLMAVAFFASEFRSPPRNNNRPRRSRQRNLETVGGRKGIFLNTGAREWPKTRDATARTQTWSIQTSADFDDVFTNLHFAFHERVFQARVRKFVAPKLPDLSARATG